MRSSLFWHPCCFPLCPKQKPKQATKPTRKKNRRRARILRSKQKELARLKKERAIAEQIRRKKLQQLKQKPIKKPVEEPIDWGLSPEEEMLAIRWHMGEHTFAENSVDSENFYAALKSSGKDLIRLIQNADGMAAKSKQTDNNR